MSRGVRTFVSCLLAALLLVPGGWSATAAGAERATGSTVYRETFADGKGAATQSGGASLTLITGVVFDGNADGAALYVGNRNNDYDAADFKFADIGLEHGKTYTVTVTGYVYEGEAVPEGAQAYLQTVNSYDWLAGANFVAGSAFTLKGEFTVDTGKDSAIRVQSNAAGKHVPFCIGELTVTEKASSGGGNEPPRPPALPFRTITFEDQTTGGFTGRAGTETLTVTNEANRTEGGSYALKVEGRSNAWHGPTLRVEPYVDRGFEYKISVWVKLISPASSQLQLSTQVGNASPSYNNLVARTISVDDGWVLFEGSYRYTTVGDEYLTIYVESANNSEASFYIDDIGFERTGSGLIDIQKDLTPIKQAYRDDFLIGNAVSAADLEGIRLELLQMHHNVVTAENAMKPDQAYNAEGQFDFAAEDALVEKIQDAGLLLHGHVLVWHQQTPTWLHTGTDGQDNAVPLSRDEALANMRTHIRTVVEHFGDKVISWDVVNEAMIDNPPNPEDWRASLRRSGWYQSIGPDYVEQAFLAAREAAEENGWEIKLYYNDYNDDNQSKASAIYHMVKEMNENYAKTHPGKLLVDGIGMQGHYNINTNPENVKRSLERFISLGVEVSVTELDVQAGSNAQLTEKQAIAQGYLYAKLFELYKAHAEHIARVTFWGLNDATSWRADESPLVFDRDLQAKPAYYGIIDPVKFIEEHPPTSTEAKAATAAYGTPIVDGSVDAIWSSTQAMPINQYQTAWQGATGTARALWDERYLYVLIQVSDAQLDKSNANAWEQDSVEIFLDRNFARTTYYEADDAQYRVNFDNETSFQPASVADGFESAVLVSGTNYTVEAKIPFEFVTPGARTKLGFDAQINDAKDGARQSVAAWNDTTGTGYMDPSVFGVLTLVGSGSGDGGSGGGGGGGGGSGSGGGDGTSAPAREAVEVRNGVATIRPEVQVDGGRTKGTVTEEQWERAFGQAVPTADGPRLLVVELPAQAGATSYELQLPVRSWSEEGEFVLELRTPKAVLRIPGGMLARLNADGEAVSLRIGPADTAGWSGEIRATIGQRPAIDLSVLVDGEPIAWDDPEAAVVIAIPYAPTVAERGKPDHIAVWHIDERGAASPVPNSRYDRAAGQVVFSTTHFSAYAAVSVFRTFADGAEARWAQSAIEAMASRGAIEGVSDAAFAPAASVGRAEFLRLLVDLLELQAAGGEPFADVSAADPAYDAARIARRLGIAQGDGDGRFRPDAPMTRQEMMALTARALEAAGRLSSAGGSLSGFADASSVAEYAKDGAAALAAAGIVRGIDGELQPNGPLTRAQAAVILHRIWTMA